MNCTKKLTTSKKNAQKIYPLPQKMTQNPPKCYPPHIVAVTSEWAQTIVRESHEIAQPILRNRKYGLHELLLSKFSLCMMYFFFLSLFLDMGNKFSNEHTFIGQADDRIVSKEKAKEIFLYFCGSTSPAILPLFSKIKT